MEPTPSAPRHVPSLDGLRGLAVLLILMAHLLVTNEHPGHPLITLLTGIRISLWLGVDLFLALSGFLITGILYDLIHVDSNHACRSVARALGSFYGRRALRTLPLYLLALAALGAIARGYTAGGRPMPWLGYQWVLLTLSQNTPWGLAHAISGPIEVLSGHLWSIALEEQFYLVFPWLVLLVRDRRHLMIVAVALSLAAMGLRGWLVLHAPTAHTYQLTYKTLPCRMDGFLLGGWLALARRGPGRLAKLPLTVFSVAAAVLLYVALREHGLDWRTSAFVNGPGYTLLALAATSLIALALEPGQVARAFSVRPLRWMGRYSYGIYVWHPILAGFVIVPVRHAVARVTGSAGAQMLIAALAGMAASLFFGWLSYRAYEVHFLRLKRRLPYRLGPGA